MLLNEIVAHTRAAFPGDVIDTAWSPGETPQRPRYLSQETEEYLERNSDLRKNLFSPEPIAPFCMDELLLFLCLSFSMSLLGRTLG